MVDLRSVYKILVGKIKTGHTRGGKNENNSRKRILYLSGTSINEFMNG